MAHYKPIFTIRVVKTSLTKEPDVISAALTRVTVSLEHPETRQSQIEMAEVVATAIDDRSPLIVEAGTGVGKSLGYLVPVALSKKKTIIATATKALQDQLSKKDAPALAAAGLHPVVGVLKGRANYLCIQKMTAVTSQVHLDFDDEASLAQKRVAEWANVTTTGDRDEMTFPVPAPVWAALSMSSDECPGADRCPFGKVCFTEKARRDAARADILVVNSALYGAHLAHGANLLPPHEVVVFDEAHELPDVLTRALGVELSPGRLRALSPIIKSLDQVSLLSALDTLLSAASALETALAKRPSDEKTGLDRASTSALILAEVSLDSLGAGLEALADLTSQDEMLRLSALSMIARLRQDISRFLAPSPGDLLYVEGQVRPVLVCSPVELGPALAEVWAGVTPIFTSATIPPFLSETLGIPEPTTLALSSPFDYATHALLYIPSHLPDRRSKEAARAIARDLADLITASGGRCLALFTSYQALNEIGQIVRSRLQTPLLLQGDLPRSALLQNFSASEEVSLFATMGFWQGVDVPGRSLSLLAIDRLPFARPDDPLLNARRELAGPRAFYTVDLPRAAMLLTQGVGRLIRSASDQGVVVVYDNRLLTSSYKNVLLDRLPPMRRTSDEAEALSFIRSIIS